MSDKWDGEIRERMARCYYCDVWTYITYKIRLNPGMVRRVVRYSDCYTRDHVIPRSKGGKGGKTVACCNRCNRLKGDKSEEEFRELLKTKNPTKSFD